jgi:hypothetical protein
MLALVEETFNSVLVRNDIKVLVSSAHTSVSAPIAIQPGAACAASCLSRTYCVRYHAAPRALAVPGTLVYAAASACIALTSKRAFACRAVPERVPAGHSTRDRTSAGTPAGASASARTHGAACEPASKPELHRRRRRFLFGLQFCLGDLRVRLGGDAGHVARQPGRLGPCGASLTPPSPDPNSECCASPPTHKTRAERRHRCLRAGICPCHAGFSEPCCRGDPGQTFPDFRVGLHCGRAGALYVLAASCSLTDETARLLLH